MYEFDPTQLTDKELLEKYTISLKENCMITAGFCAGELFNRGYDIIETSNKKFKLINLNNIEEKVA